MKKRRRNLSALAIAGLAWFLIWLAPARLTPVAARTSAQPRPASGFRPSVATRLRSPGCVDVLVCGHRTNGVGRPENSVSAIRAEAALGADLTEVDVRETSDGALVLCHDPFVDRVLSGGHGRVSRMTLAEFKALRFRDAPEEGPPTLEEALEAARGRIIIDLDLKTGRMDLVAKAVLAAGALDFVVAGSGELEDLRTLRRLAPGIAVIPRAYSRAAIDDALDPSLDAVAIEIGDSLVTPEVVGRVRKAGTRLWLNSIFVRDFLTERGWLTFDPLIEAGADIVQSNDPADLLPVARAASRGRYGEVSSN